MVVFTTDTNVVFALAECLQHSPQGFYIRGAYADHLVGFNNMTPPIRA